MRHQDKKKATKSPRDNRRGLDHKLFYTQLKLTELSIVLMASMTFSLTAEGRKIPITIRAMRTRTIAMM